MSYEKLIAGSQHEQDAYALCILEHLKSVRIKSRESIDLSWFRAWRIVVTGSRIKSLGSCSRTNVTLIDCYLEPGVIDQTTNAKYATVLYPMGSVSFKESDRASENLTYVCGKSSEPVNINTGKWAEIMAPQCAISISGPVMGRCLRVCTPDVTLSAQLAEQKYTIVLQFMYARIGKSAYPAHVLPGTIFDDYINYGHNRVLNTVEQPIDNEVL